MTATSREPQHGVDGWDLVEYSYEYTYAWFHYERTVNGRYESREVIKKL